MRKVSLFRFSENALNVCPKFNQIIVNLVVGQNTNLAINFVYLCGLKGGMMKNALRSQ